MNEKIQKYCQKLNLSLVAKQWSAITDQAAKNNVPYSSFLFSFLEAEVIERHQKTTKTLIMLSKFPFRKL